MEEDLYCPMCFSALDADAIEDGWCPECGADLTDLSGSGSPDADNEAGDSDESGDDVEKTVIATLFFFGD